MASPATPPTAEARLDRFLAAPRRALWSLSIPILIGMAVQTLYLIVDMIFVGQISGDALTALAFNMPPMFLVMGAAFGLGSGITALVAQAVGARDRAAASRVAEQAVVLAAAMLAVFMVPGLLWGPDILRALGVPPDLLADAWAYLRVTVFGFPLLFIAVFGRSILAGEGDVRLPVMIQLAGTVANIVLDPILIFGLGLGVVGAALATVIAQAGVALAFVYLLLVRRRGYVELRLSRLRPHAETINAILRIGAPASLSMVVMSIGGGAFNRILVAHSADAVAAHQIGNRLDHIVILPMVALAMSLVTLVGMFHGAGRADLLIGIVRYALTRAIAIGFVLSALMYAGAPAIIGVFTDSEAIHRLGVRYLHTLAFAYPFFPISMLTGRALQGLGRGTPELVLSLLRVLLIAVPLAWLTTFVWHWPVHWVWISMVISSLVSAATAGLWLASGLRQVVDRAASALAAGAGEVKHQSALESTP